MCFSATASFVASGGLAVLGGTSLVVAKKEDKILAVIPFIFAIQQAFEGVQWLYIRGGSTSLFAAYGFLFFAFFVWPIYVPVSVFLLDKNKRGIMSLFILIGTVVALYFAFLIPFQPLYINRFPSCISYDFNFPLWPLINSMYMLAIFGPFLISSHRIFRWYGTVILFLAIVSLLFFMVAFTSVWCFFAAVVSSMFLFYCIKRRERSKNFERQVNSLE